MVGEHGSISTTKEPGLAEVPPHGFPSRAVAAPTPQACEGPRICGALGKPTGSLSMGRRWGKPCPWKDIFLMTVADGFKCPSSGFILLFQRGVFLKYLLCSTAF